MTTTRKTTTTALTILAIILTAAWLSNPVGLAGAAALYLALATWCLASIAGFGEREVRSASTAK